MERTTDFTANLKPAAPSGAETIAEERARSAIDVQALSKHLLGDEFLERQKRILELLQDEKLFSKTTQMNLSRPERYHLGLARAKKLRRMADQYSWTDDDYEMAKYLVDDVSPYTLHTTMFRQTLREQTSDEQREYWLARHGRWEIIGCYAQTELGHGSNVKGIETEARWDPKTKEFIIHSPSLTASKWWNGSMGRTANHAIVVAQLLVPHAATPDKYKNYGPHPFIVQIRDMKSHQPFEGIVVGDIGPKYGYAPMDNGYMLFNHYRYRVISYWDIPIQFRANGPKSTTQRYVVSICQSQFRYRGVHKARESQCDIRIVNFCKAKHPGLPPQFC